MTTPAQPTPLARLAGVLSVRYAHASMIAIAIAVGLVSGFAALGFRHLIELTHHLVNRLARTDVAPWYALMFLPAAGGIVVGLITSRIAQEARGGGVSAVIYAVLKRGGRIRRRVAATKAITSAVTIGSGGSAGSEGPIVQIGAALGSALGQWVGLSGERLRTLLACGAAAGIAGIFNAPIAGVLFAVEVILGGYAVRTFTPLVIASVVATAVSRHYLGNHPAFPIAETGLGHPIELPFYGLLGVVCGGVAALWIAAMERAEELFERPRLPEWLKPALGGLGVGVIGLFVPQVLGVGYPHIGEVIAVEYRLTFLVALVAAKFAATLLTLGSGGSGGEFAPLLFIGACIGCIFGKLVAWVIPGLEPTVGTFALVGMGALLAGATHSPMTAMLMLFELTGNSLIILPLMLGCILSLFVATRLRRESTYSARLTRMGALRGMGREAEVMSTRRVAQMMHEPAVRLRPTTPYAEVAAHLLNERYHHLFVTDDAGRLTGVVSLDDVKAVMHDEDLANFAIAHDLMSAVPCVVTPEDTLAACMDLFARHEVEAIPVVRDDTSRQLIGVVTRRDLFALYNAEVLLGGDPTAVRYVPDEREGDDDVEGHDGDEAGRTRAAGTVTLPRGFVVRAIPVPRAMVGRTLRELDLRRRHGVSVTGLRRRQSDGSHTALAPDADTPLDEAMTLVVIGGERAVEELLARGGR